jgi:[histone H3]-lysine36 N-trimethyltransferase
MSDPGTENAAELEPELRDMKIEEGATTEETAGEKSLEMAQVKAEDTLGRTPTPVQLAPRFKSRSKSQSPVKQLPSDASSPDTGAHEEVLGGEITLKMEPGKAPRLSRTALQKVISRPPTLYLDLPDATAEAQNTFVVLSECSYANKTIGTTEHALECDCSEEWGKLPAANTVIARTLFVSAR